MFFEAPGTSKVSRNRSGEAPRGFVQPAKVALNSQVAPKLRFRALKWLRSVGNQRESAPQPRLKSGQAANAINASSNVIRSPLSIYIYLSIYLSVCLSFSPCFLFVFFFTLFFCSFCFSSLFVFEQFELTPFSFVYICMHVRHWQYGIQRK